MQPAESPTTPPPTPSPRFLRLSAVIEQTSLKKTAIYDRIAEGTFPKQVSLGGKAVAWLAHEIDEWCQARVIESRRVNN